MQFNVLGPLEVLRDDCAVDIRGSKHRALLALLVLHANEVVRNDRLIEELWGERPPANASGALQNHISRLRKELGSEVLVTKPWGYVLRAEPGQVDLQRFETLLAEAKALPARERQTKLAEGLALWRGPALADLGKQDELAVERARLDELQLSALEQRIDADLELGEHEHLVPELEGLVAEHPLRERLRGQLILALYRSGRQAEALETYRETRRVLVEELGIEPSPELKELERAILRQDPALASAPPPVPPPEQEGRPPPPERWRWPRSPLAIGIGVLLLGGAGVAAALLVPTGASSQEVSNAAPSTLQTIGALYSLPVPLVTQVLRETATGKTTKRGHNSAHARSTEEQTTAAVVTPQQTSTHAQQQPPTKKLFRLADTFDGSTMNDRLWIEYRIGTGADLRQVGGHLELTISADAVPDPQWNATSIGYTTACSFTGDFDVRVDYELLDWPAASGAVAGIDVDWDGGNMHLLRTSETSGQEQYVFAAQTGELRRLATSDSSGRIRMKRTGAVITSYLRRSGRWVRFASARHAGAVRLQTLLYANGSNFSRVQVRSAFDNFVVLTPESSCI